MRKFHTDDVHYPDLGSASDWLKENSLTAQPIRNATKIWVVHVINMEFLRSLLRRRFARAQVGTSRISAYSKRPPGEFRKVVVTRAGRSRGWALDDLVSGQMMKQ